MTKDEVEREDSKRNTEMILDRSDELTDRFERLLKESETLLAKLLEADE